VLNLLGTDKLSKLESSLVVVKLLAIISFIIIALLLITGLFPNIPAIGRGELAREAFMPGGIKSIAGSMLIVIFTYAGFEVIGLAASEADQPSKTVPKAIKYTVLSLVGLYMVNIVSLLPLIPTGELSEKVSPMVAALDRWGMSWAGLIMNFVLISAILSTMLAAMFGLGRMMRSLVDEGHGPKWLKDKNDVPYRGILFSGLAMLTSLWLGLLLPSVYLFLLSSGGFALLFTYAFILATHIKFRKKHGCPPDGKCQMPGYPFTSWLSLISIIVIIISMPYISGQASGLVAGLILVALYALTYIVMHIMRRTKKDTPSSGAMKGLEYRDRYLMETSEELTNKGNKIEKE
jgi:L-asparagine transporter-like permease